MRDFYIVENETYYFKVDYDKFKYVFMNILKKGIYEKDYLVSFKVSNALPEKITLDFLNSLEYIKIGFSWYETRYLPLSGSDPDGIKRQIEEKNKIKYYYNEYGMMFEYLAAMKLTKKFLSALNYVGNFKLTRPKEEFIPWKNYKSIRIDDSFNEEIISRYELFNLKKSEAFDKEYSDRERNFWKSMNQYMGIDKY